jgi:ribosomal protein S12 methylthiotransferase accessory factor
MTWAHTTASSLNALRIRMRKRVPFARLVQPRVGLVDELVFLSQDYGVPRYEIATAELDNLTLTFPHVVRSDGGDVRDQIIGGAGSDPDREVAWIKAVAEAAERYATLAFDVDNFIEASGNELGAAALDLRSIPQCSPHELANPHCPLRAPDPSARIRWVAGISLIDGRKRYVPAVMTHLYIRARQAEMFWAPISTGVATHTDPAVAIESAICEVIERDAIATTWLTRRPLRRVEPPTGASGALGEIVRRVAASRVKYHLFDATTDLGIPTVFAIQLAPGHPTCKLSVSCASAIDPEVAYLGAIREAAPTRAALSASTVIPDDPMDFHDLLHGAAYHARRADHAAFGFLLEGTATTTLGEMAERAAIRGATARDRVCSLIAQLRARGMQVIALDLTTDELRAVGLWVIRVVIPELVPISFVHSARYLATPRLYETWRSRCPDACEADINPSPLPFA